MKLKDKMKLEEVEEPQYDTNWCQRCDENYCVECVDFNEVEFDIEENVYANRPDSKPLFQNWKGEMVCPFCYNQLAKKKNKEVK